MMFFVFVEKAMVLLSLCKESIGICLCKVATVKVCDVSYEDGLAEERCFMWSG